MPLFLSLPPPWEGSSLAGSSYGCGARGCCKHSPAVGGRWVRTRARWGRPTAGTVSISSPLRAGGSEVVLSPPPHTHQPGPPCLPRSKQGAPRPAGAHHASMRQHACPPRAARSRRRRRRRIRRIAAAAANPSKKSLPYIGLCGCNVWSYNITKLLVVLGGRENYWDGNTLLISSREWRVGVKKAMTIVPCPFQSSFPLRPRPFFLPPCVRRGQTHMRFIASMRF
jgi:hypothetical protein